MPDQDPIRKVGDLLLDTRTGLVTTTRPDGSLKRVSLTPIQTNLLKYLMDHPGIPQTDLEILHHVWGKDAPHTARHTVRQHIRHIRLKIEHDPAKPIYLVTLIRYGYMVSTHTEQKP